MTALTVCPNRFAEVSGYQSIADQEPGAAMFRRARSPLKKRRFRLMFELLTLAEKQAIEALYAETRGSGVFQFTPPGESQIDVQFDGSPRFRAAGPGRRYATEFEVSAYRPE